MLFSYIESFMFGRPLNQILLESGSFFVPLLIYEYISYYDIKIKNILYTLFVTCAICGILSVLVATRVIETNTWAAEGDFVRSAGFVDGTCGVAGFFASISILGNKKSEYSRVLSFIGLVGSILTLVLGFSRLRIIILLLGLVVYVFMRQKDGQGNNTTSRKYIVLGALFIVLLLYIASHKDIFEIIERMFLTRFGNLGEDSSSTFRTDEMKMHFHLLKESWGLGYGWGFRNQYFIGQTEIFVHMVYSGVLMHLGIIFGTLYNLYFLKIFRDSFCAWRKKKSIERQIGFLEILVLLFVGFGGGGITQGGALFIMAIHFANNNLKMRNIA